MAVVKENLALIGFMGCGKSAIGSAAAVKLGYRLIDCDKEITRSVGATVSHIFETYGEDYFRELEKNLILGLENAARCVISTGGGIVKTGGNIERLKKNSVVVYLKASPEKIYGNLLNDNSRPLLNAPDKLLRIRQLLAERAPLYIENADIITDVTDMGIDAAADAVVSAYKRRCGLE